MWNADPRPPRVRRGPCPAKAPAAIAAACLLAACRGPQSALDPLGPAADAIAQIWWVMFWGACAVLALVLSLLAYALFRRGRGPALRKPDRFIVGGGLVFPAVTLAALLVYGVAGSRHVTGMDQSVDVVIDVVARRWSWEFLYHAGADPAGRPVARSFDRLVLPLDQTVELRVTSLDVIHSFWVPRLGGKIDAIPGRVNRLRLRADAAEPARGQCAEFCGLEHAHMTFDVVILASPQYRAWLGAAAAPAGMPAP